MSEKPAPPESGKAAEDGRKAERLAEAHGRKAERLGEALRANLARRKARQRARDAAGRGENERG